MFGGVEMVNGNLNRESQEKVKKVIGSLSKAISEIFSKHGLEKWQIPLLRPANFVVVLMNNGLYLIIDSAPISGLPNHYYIDRRDIITPIPLDSLRVESVRDLGFKDPIGIFLPSITLSDDENTARTAINSVAEMICVEMAKAVKIGRFNIPKNFLHLQRFAPNFLHDHPHPDSNVFLMMRFGKSEQYDMIEKILRKKFQDYGLNVLRADDKDYTGDLWDNVCVYMIGCKYGIVVFEEINERDFNPSVALELGFMMAHGKRCLLLKDQRMPKMPTDIVGKLYKLFDAYKIEQSISDAVDSWAKDIGLKNNKEADSQATPI
jgi:hypothetical protein